MDYLRANPLTCLIASNTLVGALGVWAVSEGRPLSFLYKQLFKAAFALVPSSLVDAENARLKAQIEESVIGSSLDGEVSFPSLPAEGLPRSEVLDMLQRYSDKDREKWNTGKVRRLVGNAMLLHGTPRPDTLPPPSPPPFPPLRSLAQSTTAGRS